MLSQGFYKTKLTNKIHKNELFANNDDSTITTWPSIMQSHKCLDVKLKTYQIY